MTEDGTVILRCRAPDSVGIMAAVTSFLAERKQNIIESHDFGDPETNTFFIRIAFSGLNSEDDFQTFKSEFGDCASSMNMTWSMRRASQKPRAVILASKSDHCLNDLLYRHRRKRLGVEVAAVISNHENASWHANRHDLPFFHVPVTPDTKKEAETRLESLVTEVGADVIILARYMQILSNELAKKWEGRCINIHHSFLPSFKGAKPYHQAHKKGVKLIGATAHFVTGDLDEGPIIAQDVLPVDHRKSARQMAELGRDIEARVLVRGVRAFGEGRIFLNGSRTIVFD